MSTGQLAQINIGRLIAPIDDPRIAGFVSQLDAINALAESSPGFIWRLQSEAGNATDISYNDDRCRVQSNSGIWMLGMFRRIAISLYMEWRSARRKPDHVTTTHFQSLLAEDNRRRAVRLFTTSRPNVRTPS